MGCGASSAQPVPNTVSKIDEDLATSAEEAKLHLKVLLLGAGESGKSTLCKQLKNLSGTQGLQPREKALVVTSICRNTIESAVVLVEAMESLGIKFESQAGAAAAARLATVPAGDTLTPELAEEVVAVWADAGAQAAWKKRHSFWILDAAPFYFQHAVRFAAATYEPTEEDAVMCRVVSTGVSVVELREPPITYSVVDVGGQRNERRKWIHVFDDVKAIVFVDSLAGYNQVLYEDANKLRLLESLELFSQVVSNPLFRDTPLFLVLNKKDLFESMIKDGSSLSVCFPEYAGPPGDVHAALDYIESRYREVLAQAVPKKRLHVVAIAARVKLEVKSAWADIKQLTAKQAGVGSPGSQRSGSISLSGHRVTSNGTPVHAA